MICQRCRMSISPQRQVLLLERRDIPYCNGCRRLIVSTRNSTVDEEEDMEEKMK